MKLDVDNAVEVAAADDTKCHRIFQSDSVFTRLSDVCAACRVIISENACLAPRSGLILVPWAHLDWYMWGRHISSQVTNSSRGGGGALSAPTFTTADLPKGCSSESHEQLKASQMSTEMVLRCLRSSAARVSGHSLSEDLGLARSPAPAGTRMWRISIELSAAFGNKLVGERAADSTAVDHGEETLGATGNTFHSC